MDDLMFQLMKLKAKGYCCAQMIVILALEVQGKADADLVRSFGGLCFGINESGEVCGALSGGACLVSLFAGKGGDEERHHEAYPIMMAELVDWFRNKAAQEYGGARCDEILARFPDRSMCGRIVADTYLKCTEILNEYGFGPFAGIG